METTKRKRKLVKKRDGEVLTPVAQAKPGGEVILTQPKQDQPRTKAEWDVWRWLQIGMQLNLQTSN